MTRSLLALALVALIAACDSVHTIVGPVPFKCPPLDSALVRAKRDSFISPIYCPLTPPVDTSKPK